MPSYIMKLTDPVDNADYYLEWSTIVDAPVTYGMPLHGLKEYWKYQYGEEGMKELPNRLARVEECGISALPPFDKLEGYFNFNYAGEDGKRASKEEIISKYCTNSPFSKKNLLLTPLTKELFDALGFTEYWAGCGDFGDRWLDLGEKPSYKIRSIDATEAASYGGYEVEACPHHWTTEDWEEMTTLGDMYEDVKRRRLPEVIARFVEIVKEKINIEL